MYPWKGRRHESERFASDPRTEVGSVYIVGIGEERGLTKQAPGHFGGHDDEEQGENPFQSIDR